MKNLERWKDIIYRQLVDIYVTLGIIDVDWHYCLVDPIEWTHPFYGHQN